ncbi:MAG: glyceraldehyde 3-phosphate dehydrogenase NAD-binding domain-containing protein, partial [Acidimicrobiia bacterium]
MGFGRIGRNVFRLLHDRDDLDVVAISDIANPEALTYL